MQASLTLFRVQATAESLQQLLDRNALPDVPDYCRVQPGVESARRMVTYAHKLSYTTFAPPGFVAGTTNLRNFRPPAPQDWQLRASLLHQFAGASHLPSLLNDRLLHASGQAGVCPDLSIRQVQASCLHHHVGTGLVSGCSSSLCWNKQVHVCLL